MKTFKQFKNEVLKDRKVRKEYEALAFEYELVSSIIEKRIGQGWSQEKLAKKIGSKQPVISRLERGNYNPSLKFLNRVAKALNAELRVTLQ